MKKAILSFIIYCILFNSLSANAQAGWQWGICSHSHTYGREIDVWYTVVDQSGNVFVAGQCPSSGTIYDTLYLDTIKVVGPEDNAAPLVITKVDSSGHFVWTIEAEYSRAFCYSMVTDDSGNLYVWGGYNDSMLSIGSVTLYNPSATTTLTYFLAKISSDGVPLWATNVAQTSTLYLNSGELVIGVSASNGSMGIDHAGNVYVSGDFILPSISIGTTTLYNDNPSGDSSDVFIAKYNSLGNPVWAKSFGGTDNDGVYKMSVAEDGNLYVTWGSNSDSIVIEGVTLYATERIKPLTLHTTYKDLNGLSKYDSSGNFIWAKTLSNHFGVTAMAIDSLENIYTSGTADSTVIIGPDTLLGCFVTKFDSSGIATLVVSVTDLHNIVYSIACDLSGNIWLCVPWLEPITIPYNFNGHTLAYPSDTVSDAVFFVEYCKNGNYLTSFALPSGGDDYCGIGVDAYSDLYIGGDFESVAKMGLGADTIYGSNGEQLFVGKYKYDDTGCSAKPLAIKIDTTICTQSDTITFTLIAPPGSNYLWYDGATTSTHTESSSGIYWVSFFSGPTFIVDTFYVTFAHASPPCNTIAGLAQLPVSQGISIFPNPAADELTIQSTGQAITQITITNLIGQTVYSNQYNSNEVHVGLANLPAGLYFVKVNGSEVRKFVKE